MRIPGQPDHDSEIISVSIPKLIRSRFRMKPITHSDIQPVSFAGCRNGDRINIGTISTGTGTECSGSACAVCPFLVTGFPAYGGRGG